MVVEDARHKPHGALGEDYHLLTRVRGLITSVGVIDR